MAPILTRPTGTGSNNSIEDLLRRRFGTLAPPPVPTLQNPRSVAAQERSQAIALARAEYEAMTLAQLQDEIEKAGREDIEAMKAKAVEEERSLFFNQPHAVADLSYWGKMAHWKLDEAIALSLGKDPIEVNWSTVNGSGDGYILAALKNSPFRREYARRRELTNRAAAAYELSDPIKPEAFLTWSLNTFDSVPAELVEQVRMMGKRIADVHVPTKRVVELEAQLATSGKAATVKDRDRPLDPRERTTLLCIIGALAGHAKLDLSKPTKAGDAIAAMMPGLKLAGRTIGEHFKEVREAMDSRKVK